MKGNNFVVLSLFIHNAKFNMMKCKDALSKYRQETKTCDTFFRPQKTGFNAKIGKQLKKIIFIGSLAGIGLFMNSCMAGYVTSEPTYSEYSRPQRPSDVHVWIDGDWVYNQSSHVYVQKRGYWTRPQPNRIYIKGSWQSSSKGKHWEKGRWEKNKNYKKNRHSGNRHQKNRRSR